MISLFRPSPTILYWKFTLSRIRTYPVHMVQLTSGGSMLGQHRRPWPIMGLN